MPVTVGSVIAPTALCCGPYGNPTVLPVSIATTSPYFGNVNQQTATSMCTGGLDHAYWYWSNQLVQTNVTASLTAASWLTVYGQSATLTVTGHVFVPPIAKPKRIVPAVIRAGRRALRRSIDIYARFRGIEEARRFINFEPVVWEGQRNNYRAQRRGSRLPGPDRYKAPSLLAQAMNPEYDMHTPYNLTLLDKETGEALANGCILFDGLPIFDQMLAFWMSIQTERDEARMLGTVNWTYLSPGARQRHIRQRVERQFDRDIERGMPRSRRAEARRLMYEVERMTADQRRLDELTQGVAALAGDLGSLTVGQAA